MQKHNLINRKHQLRRDRYAWFMPFKVVTALRQFGMQFTEWRYRDERNRSWFGGHHYD